jgi:hypothetical protein
MSIRAFLRRTHPPYDGLAVGRVCSARVGSNPPQTPPQNYPPNWERRAPPTFPNPAANPTSTSITIHSFVAPDTPALRWAGCRAGVFCASETESSPDTTAELPAGLGTPRHSQRLQTRRVIRRPPPSAFGLFLRRTHPPYDGPTVDTMWAEAPKADR